MSVSLRRERRQTRRPFGGVLGAGLEKDDEEGDNQDLRVRGVGVVPNEERVALGGDGGQEFLSCAGA